MLPDLDSGRGGVACEPAHPAGRVQCPVGRMAKPGHVPRREVGRQRIEPLGLEPRRPQRLDLAPQLDSLGLVDGEPVAPHRPERVTCELREQLQRILGRAPERERPLGTEVTHGDIERHRASPEARNRRCGRLRPTRPRGPRRDERLRPACARCSAAEQPVTPPPTTTTSGLPTTAAGRLGTGLAEPVGSHVRILGMA